MPYESDLRNKPNFWEMPENLIMTKVCKVGQIALSVFYLVVQYYSSNKIRKKQNEHLFIVCQTVSNKEFNANFLTFLGLYYLFFALETIGVN